MKIRFTQVCSLGLFCHVLAFPVATTAQLECPPFDHGAPGDLCGVKQLPKGASPATECPIVDCSVTKIVDCSNCHLDKIPTDQPPCLETLDLSHNRINAIGNRSMIAYVHLRHLDLSHNKIQFLSPESFSGLSNLTCLNLFSNHLAYVKEAFPLGVFAPLRSLQTMVISKNNRHVAEPGLEYPAEALASLTSLRSLFMDGLPSPSFNAHFKNLTSLTLLSLSGYVFGDCNITSLKNRTFRNLNQIKCLYLNSCHISKIERETFKPLKNLVKLDLTHNEYIGIDNLPKIFYGLRNISSLKSLVLHLIAPRYSLSICLSNESFEYFPPSVEDLDGQENSLEAIGEGVVERLGALRTLDLSGNNFVFGRSLTFLQKMKNLATLKLNGRSYVSSLPQWFPYEVQTLSSGAFNGKSDNCLRGNGRNTPAVLKLPPRLKTLEMIHAGLIYRLTRLTVDENNQLEKLNLTENNFPTLEGPIIGLHSLRHLDLSSCFVQVIKAQFFKNLTQLQTLNLSANFLGNFFASSDSDKVFSKLGHLHELDLSFCLIERLRVDAFCGLNKLRRLRLDRNLMTRFGCNIRFMPNLRFLNLSHTRIATFNDETRRYVDSMHNKTHLRIDMSSTPISCDCSNYDFLKWMTRSKAFDRHFHGYQCNYNNMVHQRITDEYSDTLSVLGRRCASSLYLLLVVSTSATLLFVIVGVSICYRFRWNLRYLYHVAYLHYRREKGTRGQEFEFDAFICYANEDQDFVVDDLEPEMRRRGLVVHVHGRDFVAGEYISSNIVGAVCRSRKTLVVLTMNMLKSSWCNYEVQMANMEAVHTGRKVLIFLIKGSLRECSRRIDVLYNIQSNTYIDFPSLGDTNEEQMNAIWNKLVRDIRA